MTQVFVTTPARAATLALAVALGGCSAIENFMGGDKVDYRANAKKTAPLSVPPDLTQLSKESRYQTQGGVVSASSMQQPAAPGARDNAAVNAVPTVATQQAGDLKLRRDGQQRWLFSGQTPEQLWPRVKAFWIDNGFALQSEDAQLGVMETDWLEDRTKLPQDFLHKALGQLLDMVSSTGLRDRYRTRLERVDGGTEIYITHRGAEEVMTGVQRDTPVWAPRAEDPQLEAEYLGRLMAALSPKTAPALAAASPASAPAGTAGATVPVAEAGPARARALPGQPGAALQMDEGFDRAWRRVGLALDHSGFTVEDRDRTLGVYFVRYVDAKEANKEEPNFFMRLFTSKPDPSKSALSRYRVSIKSTADASTVSVLNNQGAPDNSANAQRIVSLLVDELK